ncbi:MAG TPA: Rieske 2Fe-2S domain-containing protein [Alphaproteobacteria bacterium]|nr:Rieske 2Fe-2S domain-containing protein [Alphaproteobacteria bacterium]
MTEIEVGSLGDFADGDCRVLAVGDVEVGIFRRGEKLIAYENECPHYGGPVCQGKMIPQTEEAIMPDKTSLGIRFSKTMNIICPWHGYEFSIETGRHPGDSSVRLKPVDVTVRDSRVFIRVPG